MPRHIIGDRESTIVEADQEYRILAYDRQQEDYCFITKRMRTKPLCTTLFGQELTIPRYECSRAYVFPAGMTYPAFPCVAIQDALDWAAKKSIEQRELPKWWRPEVMDETCGAVHGCSRKNYDYADYDFPIYYDGYCHPDYYMYMKSNLRKRKDDQELEYHI